MAHLHCNRKGIQRNSAASAGFSCAAIDDLLDSLANAKAGKGLKGLWIGPPTSGISEASEDLSSLARKARTACPNLKLLATWGFGEEPPADDSWTWTVKPDGQTQGTSLELYAFRFGHMLQQS